MFDCRQILNFNQSEFRENKFLLKMVETFLRIYFIESSKVEQKNKVVLTE